MAFKSPVTRQAATPPAAQGGAGGGDTPAPSNPQQPGNTQGSGSQPTKTDAQHYEDVIAAIESKAALTNEQIKAARRHVETLSGDAKTAAAGVVDQAERQQANRRESAQQKALNDIYNTNVQGIKNALSSYNTSADKDVKDGFYNKIIYESFDVNKHQRAQDGNRTEGSKEICSIIDSYSWTNDSFTPAAASINNNEISTTAPIPHCYLVEYQQMHSSNITNFVNTLAAAANAITDASTQSAFSTVQNKVKTLWSALKAMQWSADEGSQSSEGEGGGEGDNKPKETPMPSQFYTNILTNMSKLSSGIWKELSGGKGIQNAIMNSPHLAPYKLLYSLNPTDQRFVFPMLSQPPINKVVNLFADKQDENSLLSNISPINWISKVSTGVVNFVRDVKDLSHLFGGSNSETYQLSHVEKAKFFNYPQQTQEYTITFPLLNTVKSNSSVPNWKKNYKFLFLFSLRNMIYRRDNASFFPPLFYDLIIPGVIRQPFCYVKDISVKPLGIVRMLSYQDMTTFTDGKKFSVAVPQAWIVTIKLKSLLATTSNMVLSSLTDLSINAEVKQVGST